MKSCLHPSITTVDSLDPYLDIAHAAGYQWVDVLDTWIEAAIEAEGFGAVRGAFESRALQLASFGLPVNFHGEEAVFQADLAKLPMFAERRLTLGATRCCTWLWPSVDEKPAQYASRLATRFRACADILAAYGIRLGLEFVGPHHLRNKKYPFVQNLSDLLPFLEAIGASNVGILMDSYHCYTADVKMEELLALKAHQIVHVHMNDTSEAPADAHDGRRLLPGDGRIDLASFLQALYNIGYSGPVSAEVLHQEPLAGTDQSRALQVRQVIDQIIDGIRKELV